jgi:hypothetical protein
MSVTQEQLDRWRAFAAQTLVDVREVRRLIACGQTMAADQLLHGMHDSAIIAGLGMDDAGANRPAGMPARPTGADRRAAEHEANE